MKILLSYASADKEWVDELVSLLRAEGLDPDSADTFPTGENWESLLRQRIESADLVVSVMTSRALQSSWVLFEYGAAKAARKLVLPLWVLNAAEPLDIPQGQTEPYRPVESPQDAAEQIKRHVASQLAGV